MQHVDVAVQIVEKLDQLIKKFYTGSKLESNSIFIQYLLAKVTDISNIGQKCTKLPIILLNCFTVNTNFPFLKISFERCSLCINFWIHPDLIVLKTE